jgi:hypothetical protein
MDTYVHVTDDSKLLAVKLFEQNDPEAQNGELKDQKKIGVKRKNGVKPSEKMA